MDMSQCRFLHNPSLRNKLLYNCYR